MNSLWDLLLVLRSDPQALARLDCDRDGRIDTEEWEVARSSALDAVRRAGEDRIALAAHPRGRAPFYSSDRDERQVLTRHKRGALLEIAGGAALALACWAGLRRPSKRRRQHPPGRPCDRGR